MAVENTRIVVLGTPKADKEFDVYLVDRDASQKEADRLAKASKRANKELLKLVRELKRG